MLRKYTQGKIHRWDQFVNAAVFACRIHKHRTTGFSPYFLVYGQDLKLPGDFLPPFISITNPAQEESTVLQGRIHEVR